MKRIFLGLIIILVLAIISFKYSYALFTSNKVSGNNTFTAAAEFPSVSVNPTPVPTTPTPSPNPGDPYVDKVTNVTGTFGHCCSDLSSDSTIAENAVKGAHDSPPSSNFIQISDESSITMKFEDNKALPSGDSSPDIKVYIYDTLFPATAKIEVSQDGATWFVLSTNSSDTVNADLNFESTGLSYVKYVRIADNIDPEDPYPTLGFDLDAVEALYSQIDP